ncbi:hypothetical protein [Escherichia coli]|uniref:hypothetical protein n=1 Tax=Escherichia coli TaxID=562 RepID=UPI002FCD3EFB
MFKLLITLINCQNGDVRQFVHAEKYPTCDDALRAAPSHGVHPRQQTGEINPQMHGKHYGDGGVTMYEIHIKIA